MREIVQVDPVGQVERPPSQLGRQSDQSDPARIVVAHPQLRQRHAQFSIEQALAGGRRSRPGRFDQRRDLTRQQLNGAGGRAGFELSSTSRSISASISLPARGSGIGR